MWNELKYIYTRISGRYAPQILAPAEGLPSRARRGSLRSLAYSKADFASCNIHGASLFPFFSFSLFSLFSLFPFFHFFSHFIWLFSLFSLFDFLHFLPHHHHLVLHDHLGDKLPVWRGDKQISTFLESGLTNGFSRASSKESKRTLEVPERSLGGFWHNGCP